MACVCVIIVKLINYIYQLTHYLLHLTNLHVPLVQKNLWCRHAFQTSNFHKIYLADIHVHTICQKTLKRIGFNITSQLHIETLNITKYNININIMQQNKKHYNLDV